MADDRGGEAGDGPRARGGEPAPGRRTSATAAAGLEAARRRLLELQRADGHWCAELEGDTILESEYALLLFYLGRQGEPRFRQAAEYLRRQRLPGSGWAIYPGGPPDVSASVKAYFVLKLAGDDPASPAMAEAREAIRRLGGIEATNSFTKLYLAIFGQYSWRRAPAVPPELVLLPRWAPCNIYEMSAWSRTIVVPLSIVWAKKPRREVPAASALDELHVDNGHPVMSPAARAAGWRGKLWHAFFRLVDLSIKWVEALPIDPFRRRSLSRAEMWILDRLDSSDGLGAIFPPIINTILALDCLGYAADDPILLGQQKELEKLEILEDGALRLEPCKSPVWDTALALVTLGEAGVAPRDETLRAAGRWLLDHEARQPGDWRVKNPGLEPGGWYFEYANEFYPDCDDTAEVLTALAAVRFAAADRGRAEAATERGLAWLLAMQNRDGGWASFDRGCERELLTFIPFADHNAMIDPSTVDITGRVLKALSRLGFRPDDPVVGRAVGFVRRQQEADGSWYGRWGCNYLYGTWLALEGLAAAAEDLSVPWARRAVAWVAGCQNDDGGWGELPGSYARPQEKGQGPSTAAQTAWALLALLAAGERDSPAVRRGVDYLLATQESDGGWADEPWTGTGFPEVFYLRYHNYALYFPLRALAAYERAAGREGSET